MCVSAPPLQKTVYGASVIIFEGIMSFADKDLLKVGTVLPLRVQPVACAYCCLHVVKHVCLHLRITFLNYGNQPDLNMQNSPDKCSFDLNLNKFQATKFKTGWNL